MRQWELPADSLRSDNVTYTTGAANTLTQNANCYEMLVGDNVLKYRQIEIWDSAEWIMTEARAGLGTVRFPDPANIGGTFLQVKLIATDVGMKFEKTLLTPADMSTHPLSNEDSIYYGFTGSASTSTFNVAKKMGSVALEAAWEEIKQFYIQSAQASA
jgi:hypothetical protein